MHSWNFRMQGLQKKFWVQFHDLYVPKWSVSCEVQTHFGSFHLQGLQKKFWVQFTIYVFQNEAVCCEVQTHFGSSLPARFTEKSSGRIFTICVSLKQTCLTSTFCKNAFGTFYNFTCFQFFLCFWNTLWSSWLLHFIRMLWILTHLDCECTHKSWRTCVTLCEALSNKSWTGTLDMFCNIWTSNSR